MSKRRHAANELAAAQRLAARQEATAAGRRTTNRLMVTAYVTGLVAATAACAGTVLSLLG